MSETSSERDTLLSHYESDGLLERILEAWGTVGNAPEALALVDEFHVRGPAATKMLIDHLTVGPGDEVLDIGSGLGGPARALARATGATVWGLDLSPLYCDIANELSRRLGLADKTGFMARTVEEHAGAYAAAWTIHVGMNVSDKEPFYHAICRRLLPGAPFLIYDFVRGGGGAPAYPQPWAATEAASHLSDVASLEIDLRMAGFEVEEVANDTEAAISFLQEGLRRLDQLGGPPPLGLHLVLGPRFPEIMRNVLRNLSNGATAVAMIRARRPV
jgi:SAM-dependent methyltransferase